MHRPLPGSQHSLNEALFVALIWIGACFYTVGYAMLFAYRPSRAPALLFGMPSWVFWGVIAPWMVCTAITFWFALHRMRDEDLGEEALPEEEERNA